MNCPVLPAIFFFRKKKWLHCENVLGLDIRIVLNHFFCKLADSIKFLTLHDPQPITSHGEAGKTQIL